MYSVQGPVWPSGVITAWRRGRHTQDAGVARGGNWRAEHAMFRALAREWAAKKTYLSCGGPGQQRGGRLPICHGNRVGAFYGLSHGHAGVWASRVVNMGNLQFGTPVDLRFYFRLQVRVASRRSRGNSSCRHLYQRIAAAAHLIPVGQAIPRLKIRRRSSMATAKAMRSHQPRYRANSAALSIGARLLANQAHTTNTGDTLSDDDRHQPLCPRVRSPEIECVVNRSIWNEGEVQFAGRDPARLYHFERWDIGEWANPSGIAAHAVAQCNHRVIVLQHKCIEPLGESKSDWRIFFEISQRPGCVSMPFSEVVVAMNSSG